MTQEKTFVGLGILEDAKYSHRNVHAVYSVVTNEQWGDPKLIKGQCLYRAEMDHELATAFDCAVPAYRRLQRACMLVDGFTGHSVELVKCMGPYGDPKDNRIPACGWSGERADLLDGKRCPMCKADHVEQAENTPLYRRRYMELLMAVIPEELLSHVHKMKPEDLHVAVIDSVVARQKAGADKL